MCILLFDAGGSHAEEELRRPRCRGDDGCLLAEDAAADPRLRAASRTGRLTA